MIDVLKNRMDSISCILAIANTPAYLFKHLRRELVDVVDEVPLEDLSEELDRQLVDLGPNLEFDKRAYIYALIVLLTYDDSEEALETLRSVRNNTSVFWIKELVHYHEQRSVFTHTSESIDTEVAPTWREKDVESTNIGFELVRKDGNTSVYSF